MKTGKDKLWNTDQKRASVGGLTSVVIDFKTKY